MTVEFTPKDTLLITTVFLPVAAVPVGASDTIWRNPPPVNLGNITMTGTTTFNLQPGHLYDVEVNYQIATASSTGSVAFVTPANVVIGQVILFNNLQAHPQLCKQIIDGSVNPSFKFSFLSNVLAGVPNVGSWILIRAIT